MPDIDPNKTVFISYRHEQTRYLALVLFQALSEKRYDVFWSFADASTEQCDKLILPNIRARSYFVVLLTDMTGLYLRGDDDRLRQEIEYALDIERQIICLMIDGFEYKTAKSFMTGKLENLPSNNSLTLSYGDINHSVELLCNSYLAIPPSGEIVPLTADIRAETAQIVLQAANSLPPTPDELIAEQFYTRASWKLAIGKFEEAEADYTETIRLNPNEARAYYSRSVTRAINNPSGELEDLDAAIRLAPSPKRAYAYKSRAHRRASNDDLDGALADFDAALNLDSSLFDAYTGRAEVRRKKGDLEGEQADYESAIRLKPSYAHTVQARMKQQEGDLDGAIAEYSEAIRLGPHDSMLYVNRGGLREQKRDFEGAITDYDEAIRFSPGWPYLYYRRGYSHWRKTDLDAALADFDTTIRLEPDDGHAYAARGDVRVEKGDSEGAMADYDKAIQFRSDYIYVYTRRARARANKEDFEGAIADYDEAIRQRPDYAYGFENRGEVYFAAKEYHKALADFKKAYELRSEDLDAIAGLAITHHVLGNIDEARRLWMELVEQDARYKDVVRVREELNWADVLVEAARKLIAELET